MRGFRGSGGGREVLARSTAASSSTAWLSTRCVPSGGICRSGSRERSAQEQARVGFAPADDAQPAPSLALEATDHVERGAQRGS
jgi:hypothetical protein